MLSGIGNQNPRLCRNLYLRKCLVCWTLAGCKVQFEGICIRDWCVEITPIPNSLISQEQKITKLHIFRQTAAHGTVIMAGVGWGWRAALLHIQRLPFAVALFLWSSHFFPLIALQGIWCPGFLKFSSLINQETFANCRSGKVTLALLNQPAVFSMEEMSSICYHLNK